MVELSSMEEKVKYACEQCGAEQEVEVGAPAPTCEACGVEMARKTEGAEDTGEDEETSMDWEEDDEESEDENVSGYGERVEEGEEED